MVAPGPMQQRYIGDQTAAYNWGPNGHPIRIGASPFVLNPNSTAPSPAPQSQISYDTLHWDGDALLFTSNSSGTIDDIKIGTLAEYVPGAAHGATVLDRDQSGLVVSQHNNAGAGAWAPGSPYRQNCSGNATPTVQQTLALDQQSGEGPISEPATDGIFDGFNVIQGVRAVNDSTGQWTTPDAYAGDVDDPMSQRAFMWNRNNPIAYSDPSGYCPECVDVLIDPLGAAVEESELSETAALADSAIAEGASFSRAAEAAADFAKGSANTSVRLRNVAQSLFRAGDKLPGGTANAIRAELATGKQVAGKFHLTKGATSIRTLQNILKGGGLSEQEKASAETLLNDLRQSFGKNAPDNFLRNNVPPPILPRVVPGPGPNH
jgi:hypothetical protein